MSEKQVVALGKGIRLVRPEPGDKKLSLEVAICDDPFATSPVQLSRKRAKKLAYFLNKYADSIKESDE